MNEVLLHKTTRHHRLWCSVPCHNLKTIWLNDAPFSVGRSTENAVLPESKFTKYLFGGNHAEGLAKGKAFETRLGYTSDNWENLRNAIQESTGKYPAIFKDNNGYGDRYEQKIILYGIKGTPANVVIGWLHKLDDTLTMSSVYIKEVKEK